MIKLVDSVADLTAMRDREALELVMVLAAVNLLDARTGIAWRLVSHSTGLRLHERATLANRRVVVSDLPAELHQLPMLEADPDLLECHQTRAPISDRPGADGSRRHVFPMTGQRAIVGFLDLSCPTQLPDEKRRLVEGLLRIYGNHLALLDYSENDELTGLRNRKTFDASFAHFTRIEPSPRPSAIPHLEVERRRPTSNDQPRWLAVLDIDFFKRINDGFGHPCGDQVLVLISKLMRDSFRQSDTLFRCGGEEFMILMEPTEPRHVAGVLERFRLAVEAYDFPQVGRVTVSIGYTQVGAGDKGMVAFRRADEALYVAKRTGRNQVICHEDMEREPQPRAERAAAANQPVAQPGALALSLAAATSR